jgi:hypothetical protein
MLGGDERRQRDRGNLNELGAHSTPPGHGQVILRFLSFSSKNARSSPTCLSRSKLTTPLPHRLKKVSPSLARRIDPLAAARAAVIERGRPERVCSSGVGDRAGGGGRGAIGPNFAKIPVASEHGVTALAYL